MIINKIHIKNFRAIKELDLSFDKNISLFIGDNGTSKTTILEAINFCCSQSFNSSRVKYSDFYNNTDDNIEIKVYFDSDYTISIQDGYNKKNIKCNCIELIIKKREKKIPNKYLSNPFTIIHKVVPNLENEQQQITKNENNNTYELKRQNNKKDFEINQSLLSFNNVDIKGLPRVFYFGKDRQNQIKNNNFNSYLSFLVDDLNWHFNKNCENEGDYNNYLNNINNIENFILSTTKIDILKDIQKDLNNTFNIEKINLSFFYRKEPFNQSWFCQNIIENLPLSINNLGSGIEMIVSIIFLINLAKKSKDNIILLLDEPEINLHPKFQIELIKYLKSINSQIFFSTHSPYFVRESYNKECNIFCSNKNNKEIKLTKKDNNSIFPWGPTYSEINYYAYGYYSEEFHNDLYGYLIYLLTQNKKIDNPNIKNMDNYIIKEYKIEKKKWIRINNKEGKNNEEVSLHTYIRNYFHHPENNKNHKYTSEELKKSIDKLIDIINNEKTK